MTTQTCLGCARPVRRTRTSVADYPGTVQIYSRGLCKTCHKHGPGVAPEPRPIIKDCVGCGRPTRPKGMLAARALDFDPRPTVPRLGGRCPSCLAHFNTITEARVQYITRELEAYLRWRGRDITQIGIAS